MNENPQESSETKLNLAIIDQTFDAEQAAHREAVRLRTERLNSGNGFSKFAKGIWDSVAGDYLQLRDTRRARQSIHADGHVQMFEQTAADAESTRLATIDRFTSEYEETIHVEAGEDREVLNSENELAVELKQLLRRSIEDHLPNEATHEESLRILDAYSDSHGVDALKNGKVIAHNFFTIRDAAIGAIEHGESLDRVLENMTVTVGESRSDVRTEANYTAVDKIIDKLGKSTVGSLVGPEVVATAATLAGTLLRFGSRKVIGAATMTVAPGVAAGLWAGIKENKRVKEERSDHSRDMARGKGFEPGAKRREEMDQTRYETVDAMSLADELHSRFGEDADLDNHDTLRNSIDTLAAVQARVRMSDQRKIDLISYRDGQVEQQRLALDIALAEAKTIANQRLSPEARTALGLPLDIELNELLNQQAEEFIDSLETDISSKDAAFKKLRHRRVALASVKGAVIGMTIGAVVQEGIAAFDDTRQGLVEQLWHAHNTPFQGEQHQTLLYGLVHGSHGQDVVTHHAAESTYNNSVIGTNGGQYELSADHNLVNNGNGTLDLVDKSGNVTVDNLPVNPDGSLPQSSIDILHSHGMSVVDTSHNIDVPNTQTTNVSVDQYIANHPDQVTRITRDGWYDNNTPHIYDRNELGLHWGGAGGSDGHGGYVMSVATMTKGGSFSGNHSVDWSQQAHNGNLQLAISGSKGTQSEVFMVNIGPDGKIDIPAGSPAAQFFSTENGHTTFNGAYAEVVQKTGIDANGVEHVRPLATLVGHNNVGNIPDTITTHTPELKPEYQITTNGYDTTEHSESFTEMAPVVPVVPRRPLEMLARRERNNYYGYGYEGDGDISEEEVIKETNERSPRLKSNPDAVLQPQEELSWYKDELLKRRGVDGLALIEQKIDSSNELSSMSGDVETIVTVPVAAAQEADTIYGALSLYGRQGVDSLRKSLVLLNLNWLDTAIADPAKKAAIEKARQEIDRARQDFPDLKIAVVENEYNSERVQETGGVIGYVAADLADSAMLAIQKRMQAGAMSPDHEVVLIRNDADPEGMSLRYLEQYQKAIHDPKIKDMDVFKGVTRFGVKWAEKYPGFAVASNFAAALSVALSNRGLPATGGANFAIKASTLAAVGGLGVMTRTGAGSDDGALGRRIRHARNGIGVIRKEDNTQSSVLPNNVSVNYRTVAAHVMGATVDTNPSRLVPYYIQGSSYTNAWGSDFSSGDGGYRERAAGMTVTPDGKSEIANDWSTQFRGIESTITSEMHWNGTQDINRVLSIFFGGIPGGYVITGVGNNTDEESYYHNAQFKLTKAGRDYLKKRFKREGYGKNLRENLYRGDARKSRTPTLISPQ